MRVQNIHTGEIRTLAYVERLVYSGQAAFVDRDGTVKCPKCGRLDVKYLASIRQFVCSTEHYDGKLFEAKRLFFRPLEEYEQKRLRYEIAKASEDNRFNVFTESEVKRRVWQTLNAGRMPMSGGPRMRTRQFAPIYVPPIKLTEEEVETNP